MYRSESFRAKWIPVRVKKTRQTKRLEPGSDSIRTDKALVIATFLLASPAFAQSNDALKDCPPIGQSAKGELIYSMDCKALKAENITADYKPKVPQMDLKDTVIPKSDNVQTPESTPTTGVNK
jgi:hypothetical protein